MTVRRWCNRYLQQKDRVAVVLLLFFSFVFSFVVFLPIAVCYYATETTAFVFARVYRISTPPGARGKTNFCNPFFRVYMGAPVYSNVFFVSLFFYPAPSPPPPPPRPPCYRPCTLVRPPGSSFPTINFKFLRESYSFPFVIENRC